MAQLLQLTQRLTHKYNRDWADYEQWEYRGTAKLLPPKRIEDGNGYDDLGSYHRLAIMPKTVSPTEAVSLLKQSLDHSYHRPCRHEHDCCGCVFTSYRIRHVLGRRYSVITNVSRNY